MNDSKLTPNQLAFLGLANEFCQTIEMSAEADREQLINAMLRLLPRIYISATDLPEALLLDQDTYLPSTLEEEYYDSIRRALEGVFGEDDTYLEVFEDDMKYSDTPIATSISEGLSDIFQVMYNLTENVKDAPIELVLQYLDAAKEDFASYWSRPLCNVLRAINAIKYQ